MCVLSICQEQASFCGCLCTYFLSALANPSCISVLVSVQPVAQFLSQRLLRSGLCGNHCQVTPADKGCPVLLYLLWDNWEKLLLTVASQVREAGPWPGSETSPTLNRKGTCPVW